MKGGIKIKAMEKILLSKELNLIKKEKELKKKKILTLNWRIEQKRKDYR